ncbi:M23 family metallopeptidase [Paenibacillus apiarius]|uniref:Peptidoglycan DD-metalloendopeptidase family protein n=1 Tax=Paenibacillus apiarius TaxID=46240 RepID=A0ABT4DYS3_9BACL|nr:M23 family metallopeptidase [Paenibacillus apiarius]MCY9516424.1 peptidoglycan DD-metalloendopeptidase family protein [Paenibacillus apiarius]MCY9521116.1 peptidoglycan DD-metalloendopeptidase family protein [Paenibacillus apiarius]MCY9551963.1 peptidoglycan DD-metalloendopeptidase family protein [Paenibacillus apiarius]MCY9560908.1 peptidoglycan DD-metalloendopeptidase family protein [Paenibacillus apiarius]MCY9684537.1 peptidoglycan DD-metalloendopeptidase family protein [Paenibacillus ap
MMKRRWWKGRMTLLVIRDAEQTVRQLNMSKMLIVSVPIAAVLSISGLILSMQWKSAAHIRDLEGQLSNQSAALDITVKDKDEAIRLLQNEIVRLSSETQSVKARVKQMSELELQMQQFVEGYINVPEDTNSPSTYTAQHTAWNERVQVGGEARKVRSEQIIDLAHRSSFDLEQVRRMLATVQRSAPATLKQALTKQTTIAGTPSIWPTTSRRITSSFGYRQDPLNGRAAFHAGIDIGGEMGDPVYAAADGEVTEAGFNSGRGNYIIVRHVNQLETWYMHLQRIDVKAGERVAKGDEIAKVGTTGRSTGPHLHFQIVQKSEPIDPLPFVGNAPSVKSAASSPLKPSPSNRRPLLPNNPQLASGSREKY